MTLQKSSGIYVLGLEWLEGANSALEGCSTRQVFTQMSPMSLFVQETYVEALEKFSTEAADPSQSATGRSVPSLQLV